IIIYINLKYCKNYNKIHVNIYEYAISFIYYIIYLLLNSVFILISYQYLIYFILSYYILLFHCIFILFYFILFYFD
ncbi:hypothetical protein H8356DRAFT_1618440, partial [Neocallimastix lanati (nom. inval.)]